MNTGLMASASSSPVQPRTSLQFKMTIAEMPGNEIANLLENSVMSRGWTFLCFHTRRVAVNEESIQPFFCPAVGWL